MSTPEVHDFLNRPGSFFFSGGEINEGMLVARYNIGGARIEYFFIPSSRLGEYSLGRKTHEPDLPQRLGVRIEVNTILGAALKDSKP